MKRIFSSYIPVFKASLVFIQELTQKHLQKKINEQTKQKQLHWCRKQADGCQMRGWGWVREVKGDKRYKPLVIII